MSRFASFRNIRAIAFLMSVLLFFLGLSAFALTVRQKGLLHDLEKAHAVKELELMATLAREALIKRDYAMVEQFFHTRLEFEERDRAR